MYFKGTFSLQVKDGMQPYQTLPRLVTYALQEPFKKKLERLQKQQTIGPLGVEKPWNSA